MKPTLLICTTALTFAIGPATQAVAQSNPFLDGWNLSNERPAQSKKTSPPSTRSSVPSAAPAEADPSMVPAVVGLPPDPNPDTTYRIAPGDQLEISVFDAAELSSKERVSEVGTVMIALIGPVKVADLTPDEAEKAIANALGRDYLQDPQVDINVVSATNQQVTVAGSVKKPGVFPIAGRTTLLQAISLAEGPGPLANQEEVIIFRADATGQGQAYVVNLDAVQKGELQDPVLIGNDRVVVPESGTAVFIKGVTDALRGFVHMTPF